jgi:hypothetical protein
LGFTDGSLDVSCSRNKTAFHTCIPERHCFILGTCCFAGTEPTGRDSRSTLSRESLCGRRRWWSPGLISHSCVGIAAGLGSSWPTTVRRTRISDGRLTTSCRLREVAPMILRTFNPCSGRTTATRATRGLNGVASSAQREPRLSQSVRRGVEPRARTSRFCPSDDEGLRGFSTGPSTGYRSVSNMLISL